MSDEITVLLVDDQPLLREGLRLMLDLRPDITVIDEADNGEEAVAKVAATPPNVVLMDIRMPVMDGVEATRLIREEHPETQVIILTTFKDDEYIFEGLHAGAIGYMLKDASSDELVDAVRAAARGESFLQPSVASKVVEAFKRVSSKEGRQAAANAQLIEPLTDRELDVLRHIAAGETNREIAEALYLSEGTVKNYVTSILAKLDVRDRTQAALKAREMGLV